MKTIIAGSRTLTDRAPVRRAIAEFQALGYQITEVVSGRCPTGVDALGELWAEINSVPVKAFPAQWRNPNGSTNRAAGPIRNRSMAAYAEACIVIWDGQSRGSRNMIEEARKAGLVLLVLDYQTQQIYVSEPQITGQSCV